MVEVTGKWIKRNVRELYGGLDVDELEQYINLDDKFQTNLTMKGVWAIEKCSYDKPFSIIIPGRGLVTAKGYTEETENEKLDKLPNYLLYE